MIFFFFKVRQYIAWSLCVMLRLGVKRFLSLGARQRPLWRGTAFIAWLHLIHVCLPDLAPGDLTVHSCALPNPRCPAVCRTLALMPSSLVRPSGGGSLDLEPDYLIRCHKIQTYTCLRKTRSTFCSIFLFWVTLLPFHKSRQLLRPKIIIPPLLIC